MLLAQGLALNLTPRLLQIPVFTIVLLRSRMWRDRSLGRFHRIKAVAHWDLIRVDMLILAPEY